MRKQTFFMLLAALFLLTSCASLQNKSTANMKNYFSQAPDLSKVEYGGGDGKTSETAVVIKNAGNERNGIAAEYEYIAGKHGKRFTDWKPVGQATNSDKGKTYDIINIVTIPGNVQVTYYFDITDFYGRF